MNKIFYVYIYLDPRKPGKYKYEKYKFNYEPIYVGKGKDSRIFDFKRRNVLLKRKLNKCFEPVYLIFKDNMTEDKAFIEEKKLIATIGHLDLKRGPLCNLIDGGEGVSGLIWTEDHRRNLGKTNKGDRFDKYKKEKGSWNKGLTKETCPSLCRSPEIGRKISKAKTGKKRKPFTDEARKNMSISHMGNTNHPKGTPAWNKGLKMPTGKPAWNRGLKDPEEVRLKKKEANKKNHAGKPAWNRGLKFPEGQKRTKGQYFVARSRSDTNYKEKISEEGRRAQEEHLERSQRAKRGKNHE